MSLKTLNDFRTLEGVEKSERRNIYSRSELQEAACEWVKELEKSYYDLESDNDWIELMIKETSHRGSWGRDVLSRWIKHFFNLDDEV